MALDTLQVQAHLVDSVVSVPDHLRKVNIAIRQVKTLSGFPLLPRVMFLRHRGL